MRLVILITESVWAVKNIENFKSYGGFTGGDPKKQNVSKHVSFFGLEPQYFGPNFRILWYFPANKLSPHLSMWDGTFLKIWAKSGKIFFGSMAKKWNVEREHVSFFPGRRKFFFLRFRSNFQESCVSHRQVQGQSICWKISNGSKVRSEILWLEVKKWNVEFHVLFFGIPNSKSSLTFEVFNIFDRSDTLRDQYHQTHLSGKLQRV